ncbi:MAG: SGNH/GDSL hydrolase family protein, partial [Planctomycetes bacterium]|nr:SGNH/GDSL hydrolase family protein [Planctomycetota bacterium]
MTRKIRFCAMATLLLTLVAVLQNLAVAAEQKLQLRPRDHICYIGNTLADRMQHHAWLETSLHALHPTHNLTFRNLGFPGDEITRRSRSMNFGTPDQWLTKTKADVVFCFFGYNEALRGKAGLAGFEKNLAEMIGGMTAQKYNGKSSPKLVMFSPIAHEDLNSPHLPDGVENNKNLELYTRAMQDVCQSKGVRFVDLFTPTRTLYENARKPLTMNGIHRLEHGNRALADVIINPLVG